MLKMAGMKKLALNQYDQIDYQIASILKAYGLSREQLESHVDQFSYNDKLTLLNLVKSQIKLEEKSLIGDAVDNVIFLNSYR